MAESETKIELKYQRKDFENIYYKNRQANIFWSTPVKEYFIIFSVFSILFLLSFTYSFFTNLLWGLSIFLMFLLTLSFFSYRTKASPILKWKKQVVKYLDRLDKISHHEITLTKSTLILTQDDEVIITKWIRFTKVIFNDESIQLSGSDEYLFPKNSMTQSQFIYLKDFILDRINIES